MNIFKILSSYDGRINEPNISAFLSFLINPQEEHGLKFSLLNIIVEKLVKENNITNKRINNFLKYYTKYDVDIKPEYPVNVIETKTKNERRDIDILIEIYKDKENQEYPDIAICIENKITINALSDIYQLQDEAFGIQKEYNEDKENTEIYFILLVPEKTTKIMQSFDFVNNMEKIIFLWKNNESSIIEFLKMILEKERYAEIDPINTEVKFIVKSFMAFINNNFKSEENLGMELKRENYTMSIIEYLNEIYNELEYEKEYFVDEIKNRLKNIVEEKSGKKLNNTTKNCQFYRVTINDKSRTNYNIKSPYDERVNLFYYVDENNRSKIKKFNINIIQDDVNIYWLEGEERVSKKISEIKKENGI
jgi:hypothetical protein